MKIISGSRRGQAVAESRETSSITNIIEQQLQITVVRYTSESITMHLHR